MFDIRQSFKTGLGFGLTSGVITTLGLMVGLYSGTHSKLVVMSSIVIIAISDALSDALGIHVSEESDVETSSREVWESTLSTLLSKFIVALTFIVPVLFFDLGRAVSVAVLWGLLLISLFSAYIAKKKKEKVFESVLEHVAITALVVSISYHVGGWISTLA